jgi:hypothetical protein
MKFVAAVAVVASSCLVGLVSAQAAGLARLPRCAVSVDLFLLHVHELPPSSFPPAVELFLDCRHAIMPFSMFDVWFIRPTPKHDLLGAQSLRQY